MFLSRGRREKIDDVSASSKYAVLWDVRGHASRPFGVVAEHGDHVHVFVPKECGVPTRYSDDFRVLGPGGSFVVYRPGDEGYFDQVLVDLSRVFAVGKRGTVPSLDKSSLFEIFVDEVVHADVDPQVAGYDLQGARGKFSRANEVERVARNPRAFPALA
jgi:hypothetical protein